MLCSGVRRRRQHHQGIVCSLPMFLHTQECESLDFSDLYCHERNRGHLRKQVQCNDVILEDTDVAKAIVEFVLRSAVGKLVIGASPKGGFVRYDTIAWTGNILCRDALFCHVSFRSFRSTDTSSSISKGVPDFCTVFIISKGKVSSMRNAARPPPTGALIRAQIQSQPTARPDPLDYNNRNNVMRGLCVDICLSL